MSSQIRLVVRRRKKLPGNLVKVAVLVAATTLLFLLAWSSDHVAKQKVVEQPPLAKDSYLSRTKSSPPNVPKLSIVERTKLEQHPNPDAKLMSKTGQLTQRQPGAATQTYPPVDSLLSGKYNVTGDISFLVDFAIIGFPKCGTSTMMEYLDKSPYTKVAQKERCELGTGRQAKLTRDLYKELPEGNYKRGIKCPRDLENEFSMAGYNKYFPGVHLLVGIRHPVLWLESFYNFRVYNNNPMPPVEQLLGACNKYSRHVCAHRARFHQYLANLGKTPLGPEEQKFFVHGGKELRLTPVKGKVFLYHVEQLRVDEPPLRQEELDASAMGRRQSATTGYLS
ncbi:hypothetical protein MHU86_17162 [Fragilaria crotonensis]|nr:hypothetical protein MHU86_17162 [Fragilaria crotonensis]